MKTFFFIILVLGLCPGINCASAQPTQVWQRQFGTTLSTTTTNYVAPNALWARQANRTAAVGTVSLYKFVASGGVQTSQALFWLFNAAGDTVQTTRYAAGTFGNPYKNVLPLVGGDWLITGYADSTTGAGANYAHFYVRVDSLGNRRSRLHYIKPYRADSNYDILLNLPQNGALWGHGINYYPYIPNFYGGLDEAEVVRFDSVQRIVWQRRYAGPTPNTESNQVISMAPLRDGSYVLIGTKGRAFTPPSGGSPFVVGSGWQQRIRANGDTITLPEFFGNIYELYQPAQVKPTPDGGYVVVGQVFPDKYVPAFNCCATGLGWLAKFDSLGTLKWEQRILGLNTATPSNNNPYGDGASLTSVEVLANGHYLLTGTRSRLPADQANSSYLAEYAPTLAGTGAAPVWEQYGRFGGRAARLGTTGPLYLTGVLVTSSSWLGTLTRFDNVAASVAPTNYCQHPPQVVATFQATATGTGTTLSFTEASTAGPRYAQLVRWRWHLGDGTFFEGQLPPPHLYAQPLPVGTPLTLTVTNNLGCDATLTLYPWGRPLAAAPAALARQVGVYPNPAQGTATLSVPAQLLVSGATLTLLDVLGRPVRQWPVGDVPTGTGPVARALELSSLAAGVYVLQVPTTAGLVTRRLTVQP